MESISDIAVILGLILMMLQIVRELLGIFKDKNNC
jgi:hypothetical protein